MGRAHRLLLMLLLALGLGGGCATVPPLQTIPDVATIAGEWSGVIQYGRGSYELFYLTINPDGSLIAWWGLYTRYGRVDLSQERPRFTLYTWNGDLEYLAGGGRRVLILRSDFGDLYTYL